MIAIFDRKLCAVLCVAALTACDKRVELLPPPPPPDLCTFYTPWLMSPAPAALETVGNLRIHAGNNAGHYDKCVAGNPALDPKRSGGPR